MDMPSTVKTTSQRPSAKDVLELFHIMEILGPYNSWFGGEPKLIPGVSYDRMKNAIDRLERLLELPQSMIAHFRRCTRGA